MFILVKLIIFASQIFDTFFCHFDDSLMNDIYCGFRHTAWETQTNANIYIVIDEGDLPEAHLIWKDVPLCAKMSTKNKS